MRIKADLLRIRTTPYDDKGDKVEPEAQPMQRVIQTDANVSMTGSGSQVGSIGTEIQYETTVGEYAARARNQCFTCKHFSRSDWRKLFSMWNDPTASVDKRKALNGIRAALLQTGNAEITNRSEGQDGDFDVEHALSLLGVCKPLTELRKDVVIVYPMSSCPEELCSKTTPDGLYEAKNKDMDRVGSQEFDRIMRAAQGRPG